MAAVAVVLLTTPAFETVAGATSSGLVGAGGDELRVAPALQSPTSAEEPGGAGRLEVRGPEHDAAPEAGAIRTHLADRAGSRTAGAGAADATRPDPALPGADRAAQRLAGLPATFVLGDPLQGRILLRLDPERAAERVPPCSTFKIPNTLISLEAGAVTPDDSHVPRDPAKAPARDWWPAHWDRDHDLASALGGSVVWYFQELARRVGEKTMQRRLDELEYGNRNLSGGIDRFWLSSTLAVSADEQVVLLNRLLSDGAGFRPAHLAALREPLLLSEGHGWTWYGKTGSCTLPEPSGEGTTGPYELPEEARWTLWLVGWVEGPAVPDGLRTYAFRVEADGYREGYALRDELTRRLLVDLDLLDEGILAPLEE